MNAALKEHYWSLKRLPKHQREITRTLLIRTDGKGCYICGDTRKVNRVVLNGIPAQVCDDCIDLQITMHGSVITAQLN
jgi:hypothetical protein